MRSTDTLIQCYERSQPDGALESLCAFATKPALAQFRLAFPDFADERRRRTMAFTNARDAGDEIASNTGEAIRSSLVTGDLEVSPKKTSFCNTSGTSSLEVPRAQAKTILVGRVLMETFDNQVCAMMRSLIPNKPKPGDHCHPDCYRE